jgi:hypothetical protein
MIMVIYGIPALLIIFFDALKYEAHIGDIIH